jgi:DNA-binding response OmpR family regulator
MGSKRQEGISREYGKFSTLSLIQVNSDVTIDLEGGYLKYKEGVIPFTWKEYQVLSIFVQRRQISSWGYCRVEDMVKQIYDKDSEVVDKPRAIQETIRRLRKKFAMVPGCDQIIENRPGWGYRLRISHSTNQITLQNLDEM